MHQFIWIPEKEIFLFIKFYFNILDGFNKLIEFHFHFILIFNFNFESIHVFLFFGLYFLLFKF